MHLIVGTNYLTYSDLESINDKQLFVVVLSFFCFVLFLLFLLIKNRCFVFYTSDSDQLIMIMCFNPVIQIS